MAINIYEVSLSDNRIYTVETPQHHTEVPESSFRKHLLDIITGSTSGVVSGTVTYFMFKGRK